jgi:hypothetical protein
MRNAHLLLIAAGLFDVEQYWHTKALSFNGGRNEEWKKGCPCEFKSVCQSVPASVGH